MKFDESQRGIGMTSERTRERLIDRLKEQGIKSRVVLDQIKKVPRHIFVDEALSSRAYEDTALPIGHGQTISQPFIVARMTEVLLNHVSGNKILEIGTGCGYQTAVLSPLFKKIYSVERINPLLVKTKKRLRSLGIYNVNYRHDDGWNGWEKYGPYDGIIVAAAAPRVPEKLLHQLEIGGTLIMPFGEKEKQELVIVYRDGDNFDYKRLGAVSFVPLLKGKK
tara:strand:+ start:2487 stop:3152 length:666 start_codon:yes stop_codon:yes gene_type:complete